MWHIVVFILNVFFVSTSWAACPTKWTEYNGRCYFFTTQAYRYNDALNLCSTRNSTLVIIRSNDDWSWLRGQIHTLQTDNYWIGLRVSNRSWVWVDGTTYNQANVHWFHNITPSVTDARHSCAAMNSYSNVYGQVYARYCLESHRVVCEKPNDSFELCDSSDNWEYINGFCYKLFDQKSNWFDARSICHQYNADLYVPSSYRMVQSISDLIPCRAPDQKAWIGVSDTTWPGHFVNTKNQTLRYQAFYSYGRVIVQKGSTCVYANPMTNFYWQATACSDENKFLCEKKAGTCPVGWQGYLDNCYQLNDASGSKITWFLAKQFCENQNTSLLVIEDAGEDGFIQQIMNNQKTSAAWIGFSDSDQAGTLKWMSGQTLSSSNYTNWSPHYPQKHPNQTDCGKVEAGPSSSSWSNGYCFISLPFICKAKVITKVTSPTKPATSHCDPGWTLYRSDCYLFGNDSAQSWTNARHVCYGYNADLTTIRDPYEQSFITAHIPDIGTSWIGLKYSSEYKKFRWVDSRFVNGNFQNFYPGEPDDVDDGAFCIKIQAGRQDFTGSWDDQNCTSPLSFICRKPSAPGSQSTVAPSTTPAPWNAACGQGWISNKLSNTCYQVVLSKPKTWNEALWDCNRMGGTLLNIESIREQHYIQGILSTGQYASIQSNFWIGGSDATREGGWEWINTTQPFAYLNWHPGEPNEALTGEDCMEMVTSWGYQWNDKRCDHEQQYICKKTAILPSTTAGAPTPLSPSSCDPQPLLSGDYSVLDDVIKATSQRDTIHGSPSSRIYPGSKGGWSAQHNNKGEFIQVSFYNMAIMKGVVTMGRSDALEWVTHYKIRYQYDYYSEWNWYEEPPGQVKIFTGNTDNVNQVNNTIQFPFEAKSVRLYPETWNGGISLRWEILGCIEDFCMDEYAVSGPLIVDDNKITVSSISDPSHGGPAARLQSLNPLRTPLGWKAAVDDTNQWIQVDLGKSMIIRGVTTMGSVSRQEWVTSYNILYRLNTQEDFYQEPYGNVKTIPGNVNNNETATYFFKSQFQARYVKLKPVTFSGGISLRLDILVCQHGCNAKALITGRKNLPDDLIAASSSVDSEHGPSRSRLNQPAQGPYAGAWVPLYQDLHQYIEADFGVEIQIVAIATQGRQGRSEWVSQYTLSYSVDGRQWFPYDAFTRVPIKFEGNFDSDSLRKHYLSIPVVARKIRLWPTNFHTRIALRWEIYGCPGADSGVRVGCYADNPQDRDLTYEPFTDPSVGMWPPMCVHHCFNKGYYYAGLQSQFKCFCGNSYGRYGPARDCNLSCFPLTRYQCGGKQSNMIYTTGLSAANSVCLPGWKDYNNHCYLMILNRYSWSMARSKCQTMGADLVTVNSQAEQDMITSIISSNSGSDAWIGLNDQHESNLFEWVRGDRVRFTNWNINQPRQPGNTNQKCVMLNATDGGWQTDNCDSTYQFLCEADKRPSEKPTTTPQVPGCQPGWKAYRWSCYLMIDMPRTFRDAQRVCRDSRATLVQINDRYEQAYLSSTLGQKTGMYWTDVTDLRSPGTYRFFDNGYPYLTYTNWGDQRPAGGVSRCVALNSGAGAGLWYDIMCNVTSGAICEKLRLGYTSPATPPPTTPGLPCPAGWIEINNFCYQINNMPQNRRAYYKDAQQDCQNQGANLASLHSLTDADALWRGNLVGAKTNYWIGLDDNHVDGNQKVYRWTDGSAVDYVNWGDNEPNNFHGSEDCVELVVGNGKWNDVNCYSKRNWICKIAKGSRSYQMRTTPFAPSPGPPGSCGSDVGWLFYKNHCYLVVDGAGNQAKTWREARRFCQSKGGDLVSIGSVLEQFFVQHQILNTSAADLWTGLSEVDFGIGYRWSDGSTVSFVNWSPGESNDFFGAEDCVEIRVADGKWNDEHCSSRRGFVCEKRQGAAPTNPVPPKVTGNCPGGYSADRFSNKCYRVFTTPMSWSNASKFCMGQGREKYYLASINSELDNAFVTTLLRDMNFSPWIGLVKQSDGTFRWVDNNDVTYTNWYQGEPNGIRGVTMCGRIYGYQHNAGSWDDMGCDNKAPFICETMRKTYITTPEPIPNPCNSKQGFKPFGNSCFKFVTSPKSWTDASKYCGNQGAFLVTISSEFEQAFIRLMVDGTQTWTGLNDIKSSGTYTWMNTVWPVIYTSWGAGQPSVSAGACVSVNSTTGKWQTTNCTQSLAFVCKITSDNPPVTPPAPNNQCYGSDWILNGSKCLLFRPNDFKTYLDATLECQLHHASLVSIHSIYQNQFLLQTIKAKYSVQIESIWVGLHKSSTSGFGWSDKSPTNFLNWDQNQPSSHDQWGNDENCAEIYTWNGKWNDQDCTQKRGYICQRNPVADVNPQTLPPGSNFSFPSPSGPILPPSPPIMSTPRLGSTQGASTTNRPGGTTFTAPPIQTPKAYTGPSQAGASKGSGGSKALSGGGIAGILIAAIIVTIAVIAMLVIFKRRQNGGGAALGFENTTYSYNSEQDNGKLHLNSHETES